MIYGTKHYIHPDLVDAMTMVSQDPNKFGGDEIPRNLLEHRFDRFSFGKTIVDCLWYYCSSRTDEMCWRPISAYILRALQLIALRCSDGYPEEYFTHPDHDTILDRRLFRKEIANSLKYTRSTELIENLRLIVKSDRSPGLVPEIHSVTGKDCCIPPRTFVPFAKLMQDTYDSAPIRRLAGIEQLAFCYHIYPGASHLRKEHVLGTFEITRRLLGHLMLDANNPNCALLMTERCQRIMLLASLLHDSSHIPLMHELEDALPELRQEDYLCEILNRRWGNEHFQKDLDQLLENWQCTRDELLAIFSREEVVNDLLSQKTKRRAKVVLPDWVCHWQRPEFDFMRSILDGSVDADKIDYLARDAHHSGVQYGNAVDIARLEKTCTSAIWMEDEQVRFRFAARAKGQTAAEGIISVRHSMHEGLYSHKAVRACRAMLTHLVHLYLNKKQFKNAERKVPMDLLYNYASLLQFNDPDLFKDLDLEPYPAFEMTYMDNLRYSESRLVRWLAYQCESDTASCLAESIVRRVLYKEVFLFKGDDVIEFLRKLYPSRKNRNKMEHSAARIMLRLQVRLQSCVDKFISNYWRMHSQAKVLRSTAEFRDKFEIDQQELPIVLLDISVPKNITMQKTLCIVKDNCTEFVDWGRLRDMDGSKSPGCGCGMTLSESPVYEMFSATSTEYLAAVQVRLFARQRDAEFLRSHLEAKQILNVLNQFSAKRELVQMK